MGKDSRVYAGVYKGWLSFFFTRFCFVEMFNVKTKKQRGNFMNP